MRKHWTTSDIKGMKRLDQFELWNMWNNALYKVKYNESNWISTLDDGNYNALKERDMYANIPFSSTTNKIMCIIVRIYNDDSTLTTLPSITLSARHIGTNATLAVTHNRGTASSPIPIQRPNGHEQKYLTYSYDIIEFTPSTTGVNESGVVILKRVNLAVNEMGGDTFYKTNKNTYMKFIEIGPDDLTGGYIFPKIGEPVPDSFYSAFHALITGDLYDDSVGQRYLNYLFPCDLTDKNGDAHTKGYIQSSVSAGSVFDDMIKYNNAISKKHDGNYYSTLKLITNFGINSYNTDELTGLMVMNTYRYTDTYGDSDTLSDSMSAKSTANINYTYWKEWNAVGDYLRSNAYEDDSSMRLIRCDIKISTGTSSYTQSMVNFSSTSILPGFYESKVDNVYELYQPAITGTLTNRHPLDNISLSIITNTFQLPFWYRSVSDVVQMTGKTLLPSDTVRIECKILPNPPEFDMVLKVFDDGDIDISDSGVFIKFQV